jgi:putative flippase GtrA
VLEFARFAVVGLISNALLFLLYIAVTGLGMGHKLAATLAYAIGVAQTFFFNRSWSFRDRGAPGPAFVRYVGAYAFGYVFNMAALVVLVDRAGYRHQFVQAVVILILAVTLFLLQKFWVFRDKSRG